MKIFRILAKMVSWLAVLVVAGAWGVLIYEYLNGSQGEVPVAIENFIRYTLSGAISFIKINGQSIGDILHGFVANQNISLEIFYIILIGILLVLLIIFAMSNSKIINIIEIILGIAAVLFVSWMIAIPLLVSGVFKLITKNRL